MVLEWYEIIMLIFCIACFAAVLYVVITEEDMSKHPPHHDNLPTSHYSISHQVQRDEKKRRGY